MSDTVISVEGLSKRFRMYARPWHRAVEWISAGAIQRHSDFWALQDISFELTRGECLGIIGPNGAGKSTLLKILSRSLYPTRGRFEVRGRAVSLLELGTGFHPDLTGTQNIFNSGRLLGFTDEYLKGRLPEIVEFAELGNFVDLPVHIYSSGMYVRLAFSLFACLEPEIYIIDEALAVGDSAFQKKCVDRINEMRQRGVTILFVSHDLWRVESLCNRAIYLDRGVLKCSGAPAAVAKTYLDASEARATEVRAVAAAGRIQPPAAGTVDGKPKILATQFEMYADSPLRIRRLWLSDGSRPKNEFQAEDDFEVVLEYDSRLPIKQPVFRVVFALPDERRVAVVGWQPGPEKDLQTGIGLIRWRIEGGTLYPRKYLLHASISTWDGVVYDTHYGVCELRVQSARLGPVFRVTDDLAACLKHTVVHEV
jgi:ABC-type polysaccharide/polyol phosphate transport system ATPase subunit